MIDKITLYVHVTDGGAVYLTREPNNLRTTVMRLDGGAELFPENADQLLTQIEGGNNGHKNIQG